MARVPDDYVPVHVRIEQFRAKYPEDGQIITAIVASEPVVVRAEVYANDKIIATGHACEEGGTGNRSKQGAIEMTETAAIGRALAIAGFEVKGGIASREEMEKVFRVEDGGAAPKKNGSATQHAQKLAGDWLKTICNKDEYKQFTEGVGGLGLKWWDVAMCAQEEDVTDFDGLMEYVAGKKQTAGVK